jgi:hypothetical protein
MFARVFTLVLFVNLARFVLGQGVGDELVSRTYHFDSGKTSEKALKELFAKAGMVFSSGTNLVTGVQAGKERSIRFDEITGELKVRVYPRDIAKLEEIVRTFGKHVPRVAIEVKMIEVPPPNWPLFFTNAPPVKFGQTVLSEADAKALQEKLMTVGSIVRVSNVLTLSGKKTRVIGDPDFLYQVPSDIDTIIRQAGYPDQSLIFRDRE